MLRFIIRLLRLFRPLFRRLGIHPEQLKAIVHTKLTIDNRMEKGGKSKGIPNNTLVKQVILMSVIGTFLFLMCYIVSSFTVTLLLFHSYLTLMIIMSFMGEYARLLFDSNDNQILERFPVNGRTALFARIISMLSYLYLITLGLACFPYLIVTFRKGFIEGQLFLFSALVNTLFSLLLANLFYIGLMHFFTAGNFQKIISYLQAFLAVGVIIGYQFIGKMTHVSIDLIHHPALWLFFTPPAYFMAFTEIYHTPGVWSALLAGLGASLTILLIIITLSCFSKSYIQKASSLDKIGPAKTKMRREKILLFFTRICCPDILQKSGFTLTWRMTRDNLKFKQSVLPLFIYGLIFNLIPLYRLFSQTGKARFTDLMVPLYMLPFICIGIIMNLGYSSQNNLLWIYQSRPLEQPGKILSGTFKAIYIKYFLPFLILIYLFYGLLVGISILSDLILAFSFSTLFIVVFYRYSGLVFPFSKEKSTRESGGIILKTIGTMLLLAVMGFAHFFLRLLPFGIISAIPLCWILIFLQAKQIGKLSFQQIEVHY